MPSEKDIVQEARELLESADNSLRHGQAMRLLRALVDEVERLRKQQKAHAEMVDDYYGSR